MLLRAGSPKECVVAKISNSTVVTVVASPFSSSGLRTSSELASSVKEVHLSTSPEKPGACTQARGSLAESHGPSTRFSAQYAGRSS